MIQSFRKFFVSRDVKFCEIIFTSIYPKLDSNFVLTPYLHDIINNSSSSHNTNPNIQPILSLPPADLSPSIFPTPATSTENNDILWTTIGQPRQYSWSIAIFPETVHSSDISELLIPTTSTESDIPISNHITHLLLPTHLYANPSRPKQPPTWHKDYILSAQFNHFALTPSSALDTRYLLSHFFLILVYLHPIVPCASYP